MQTRFATCRVEVKASSWTEPRSFFISRNEYNTMLASKADECEYVILLINGLDSASKSGFVHSFVVVDAILSLDIALQWTQAEIPCADLLPWMRTISTGVPLVGAPPTGEQYITDHDNIQGSLQLIGLEEQFRSINLFLEEKDLQRVLLESMRAEYDQTNARNLLRTRVCAKGYVLQEVDAQGHCQFDAIAHQIRLFHRSYPKLDCAQKYTFAQVRADLGCWLRARSEEERQALQGFLLEAERDFMDWEAFCSGVERLSPQQGCQLLWGNNLTLVAAASFYERPIRVWLSSPSAAAGESPPYVEVPGLYFDPDSAAHGAEVPEPLQIAHIYELHFMSVEPLDNGPTTTAGQLNDS